jgi:hypothetical protein
MDVSWDCLYFPLYGVDIECQTTDLDWIECCSDDLCRSGTNRRFDQRLAMTTVKYLDFRRYEERRIKVNDSMMGLLAGSQLASHTLQLTAGSPHLLGELFPNVPHIRRFNLRSEVAREILRGAESYLGAMAVPYALGLHEDFVLGCIGFFVEMGRISQNAASALRSSDMHEAFATASGVMFRPDLLQIFHVLRRMRNCQIHSGAKVDGSLLNFVSQLDQQSLALWRRLTHEAIPALNLNDEIIFTQKELGATLAVTKRLAEEANESLASVYPRDKWADKLVAEWASERSEDSANRELLFRKVRSYSRTYYRALNLTDAEIGAALERAGYRPWPRSW